MATGVVVGFPGVEERSEEQEVMVMVMVVAVVVVEEQGVE